MSSTDTPRILLYAHLSSKPCLDPHEQYQLEKIKYFGFDIFFTSNLQLDNEAITFLRGASIDNISVLRVKADFNIWQTNLLKLGRDKLLDYDEIVIMNNSTYGPFFHLSEMFHAMGETNVDFWGITRGNNKLYGEYLHTYFCVFRRNLFQSQYFWDFWRNVPEIKNKYESLLYGESSMMTQFGEAGFTHAVYADVPHMQYIPAIGLHEPFPATIASWLIKRYKTPFVSIDSFKTSPGKLYNIGSEIANAIDSCGSSYPYKLISNHLLQNRPLSWSKNQPGFLNIFEENSEILPTPNINIAVFLHLHYPSDFPKAIRLLHNIPYKFDLYISLTDKNNEVQLLKIINTANVATLNNLSIRIFPDHGRDVAHWMLGFKDVQYNYDLALKLHIKHDSRNYGYFLYEWQRFILKCTLASPGYVSRIVNLFHKRPSLGIVFHPSVPALLLTGHHRFVGETNAWNGYNNLLKMCGITPPLETSFPMFPQNLFWYRPKAFVRVFESEICYDDFPPEPFPDEGTIAHGFERASPYLVQAAGYDIALIMPKSLLLETYQRYEDHIFHMDYAGCNPYAAKDSQPW